MYSIYSIAFLILACSANVNTIITPAINTQRLVTVATAQELTTALSAAMPGDSIVMKDGIYKGKFVISVSGTATKPIVLSGSRNAILDANDISTGYVLYLNANYWRLKGFTVKNGLKGIMTDEASHNLIDNVFVTQIGEEGIHFRKFSSNNIIQNSEITHTGLNRPGYGEGIYIGSAKNNWEKYSNNNPDNCDFNKVLNNKIGPNITAECIDIKEGTTSGIIKGNTFDATGISGENSADSWMDVKGNNYTIESNTGYNPAATVLTDGYQVNCAYAGWGNNNIFKGNISEVNSSGYAINVRLQSSNGAITGTVVYTDNTAKNAVKGVSNIPLTATKN